MTPKFFKNCKLVLIFQIINLIQTFQIYKSGPKCLTMKFLIISLSKYTYLKIMVIQILSLTSSIFYYTKGKGWNPNAFSKTLMHDIMHDVVLANRWCTPSFHTPMLSCHIALSLTDTCVDTLSKQCAGFVVKWFCVFLILLVACYLILIEWQLLLCIQFDWAFT